MTGRIKDKGRDSIDFGRSRIGPLFHRLFYPTLLSMVFASLFTVADGIFVGQGVGSDALAAINIVAPLFLMTTGMALMFGGTSKTVLYTAIALVGYGNSNIFSMAFSEALLSVPDKQNEVSGLMIMGLFGGTIFPLIMGFCSDAMGQAGAVAVMAVGVIYLFTYIPRIKR